MYDFMESLSDLLQFACPVFIPSLYIFAYHSPLSLRVWFAVQEAPVHIPDSNLLPPPSTHSSVGHEDNSYLARLEARLAALDRQYSLLALIPPIWLAGILVVGTWLQTTLTQTNSIYGLDAESFFVTALFPIVLTATSRLFSTITGVEKHHVFLDLHGRPFIQASIRPDIEKALAFVPYAAAGLVSYRALLCDDWLCLSIAYGATLYLLVSTEMVATRSFRTSFACAFLNLIAMVIFVYSFLIPEDFTSFNDVIWNAAYLVDTVQNVLSMRSSASQWPLFILSVLWSIFPADFLALCYRFDYHRDVTLKALSQSTDEDIPFKSGYADDCATGIYIPCSPVPSSTSTYSPYSPEPANGQSFLDMDVHSVLGASIPTSSAIPDHHAPYFFSALTAWTLSNVVLYACLQYAGMVSPLEFHYVEALLAFLSMPAMAVAVLVRAMYDGAFSQLWHYAEQWSTDMGEASEAPISLRGDEKVAI